MKQHVEVRYLDIDGTLTTYLGYLSKEKQKEKLNLLQEVFDEFKLDFPTEEELKGKLKDHKVILNFTLSHEFSRYTLQKIISMTNNLYLDQLMEELTTKDEKFQWYCSMKQINDKYYYQIQCFDNLTKIPYIYDVKYNSKLKIKNSFQTELLEKEAIQAYNYLMKERPTKRLIYISSWSKAGEKYFKYTNELLKYQGLDFPEDMKIESLQFTNSDCGLSIGDDIQKRKIGDAYDVITDDVTSVYAMFGNHLIPVHNGLTMNDVNTYLNHTTKMENQKEKVKVLKHGN